MIRAQVGGRLASDPVSRTSKSTGKPFVLANILADHEGDRATWCRVFAFGEAADRLAGLRKGDSIAAVGTLRVGLYTPEGGEARLDLTLLADELLSVRRKPKVALDEGVAHE